MKLKTFYLVKLLISCFVKALNSILGVVILPFFRSFNISAILACSLLVIKVIWVSISLVVVRKAWLKLSLLVR